MTTATIASIQTNIMLDKGPEKQTFMDTGSKDAFSKVFESANKSLNSTQQSSFDSLSEKKFVSQDSPTEVEPYSVENRETGKDNYDKNKTSLTTSSSDAQAQATPRPANNTTSQMEDNANNKFGQSKPVNNRTEKSQNTRIENHKEALKSKVAEKNTQNTKKENNETKTSVSSTELNKLIQVQIASTVALNKQVHTETTSKVANLQQKATNINKVDSTAVKAQAANLNTHTPAATTKSAAGSSTSQVLTPSSNNAKAASTQVDQQKLQNVLSDKNSKKDETQLKVKTDKNAEVNEKAKLQTTQQISDATKQDLATNPLKIDVKDSLTSEAKPSTQANKQLKQAEKAPKKDAVTTTEVKNQEKASTENDKKENNSFTNQDSALRANITGELSAKHITINSTSGFDKVINEKQVNQPSTDNVVNQVKDKLSVLKTEKSLSITLTPDNLGKVDINLVSNKGSLSANITAENSQVKDLLSKDIDSLKETLQDKGINVDKIVVQVQEPTQSSTHNNNSFQQQDSHRFEQFSQNASSQNSNYNPNSNSSNQTTGQEKSGYTKYDQQEVAENLNNTVQEEHINTINNTKVDVRI